MVCTEGSLTFSDMDCDKRVFMTVINMTVMGH